MNVDKSACPKECVPINNKLSEKMTPNGIYLNNLYPQINGIPININPNLNVTSINQPIPSTGFNKIAINHGLPNSTLVE